MSMSQTAPRRIYTRTRMDSLWRKTPCRFMEIAQLAARAQREAEAKRQRAERLGAKLRELGISPEQVESGFPACYQW